MTNIALIFYAEDHEQNGNQHSIKVSPFATYLTIKVWQAGQNTEIDLTQNQVEILKSFLEKV